MKENERLKVLLLPRWYPHKKNPVEGMFVKDNAKAVSLYNDVIVIYNERRSGRKVKGLKLYEVFSDEKEDGIRVIRMKHRKGPIRSLTRLICLYSFWRVFERLVEEQWRPDVIHVHVHTAGRPAVIIGAKYKIPVVLTEHWSGFHRHALKKKDAPQVRFVMDKSDVVIATSKDLERAIRSYGIENRFEVVPNMVDTAVFSPAHAHRKDDKKQILLVAVISYGKGIGFLLDALAQLKEKREDFVLDIVGDGPDKKKYEKITQELNLDGIVRFHGRKAKPEVAGFMKDCDFFVLPSLYETFGVVYIEAMACGKPVIGTTAGGPKEFITKETGILAPPKDVDALVEAIDYMLEHYQDYSPEKISKYANDNFSFEVVGKKLNDIYRDVVVSLD
jgi:glycosyltransferase involved in cell wall biosynthesis